MNAIKNVANGITNYINAGMENFVENSKRLAEKATAAGTEIVNRMPVLSPENDYVVVAESACDISEDPSTSIAGVGTVATTLFESMKLTALLIYAKINGKKVVKIEKKKVEIDLE